MSACIECKKRDFNLADALRDVRLMVGIVGRRTVSAASRAKADAAVVQLARRKSEHATHAATHQESA